MAKVAVLGTGMLGAGFVQSFRRRGIEVTVWNRSRAKAEALREHGAEVADTPAAAVVGAERIHLVLSDDAAVDAVLAAIGTASTAPVIDHSTVSPAGVVRRAAALREAGRVYLHAPVFMAPTNARDATGMMLVSGPAEVVNPLLDALRPMTGKVVELGERVDQAAAFKLFGNSALITMVAAASDVLAMARALGIDGQQAMSLFTQFDPAPALRHRGGKIARGEFAPASFELSMARKDVRLMVEAAGDQRLIALPAIARRMDELLADGHGSDDLTALGRP
ncbi:MAG: NAD(P)-binding domain-containing protein [Myxococcota bacterium]